MSCAAPFCGVQKVRCPALTSSWRPAMSQSCVAAGAPAQHLWSQKRQPQLSLWSSAPSPGVRCPRSQASTRPRSSPQEHMRDHVHRTQTHLMYHIHSHMQTSTYEYNTPLPPHSNPHQECPPTGRGMSTYNHTHKAHGAQRRKG